MMLSGGPKRSYASSVGARQKTQPSPLSVHAHSLRNQPYRQVATFPDTLGLHKLTKGPKSMKLLYIVLAMVWPCLLKAGSIQEYTWNNTAITGILFYDPSTGTAAPGSVFDLPIMGDIVTFSLVGDSVTIDPIIGPYIDGGSSGTWVPDPSLGYPQTSYTVGLSMLPPLASPIYSASWEVAGPWPGEIQGYGAWVAAPDESNTLAMLGTALIFLIALPLRRNVQNALGGPSQKSNKVCPDSSRPFDVRPQ